MNNKLSCILTENYEYVIQKNDSIHCSKYIGKKIIRNNFRKILQNMKIKV
ncbi:MAG: hypothetical protein QXW79_01935 [Thermoplasmata archaeon]